MRFGFDKRHVHPAPDAESVQVAYERGRREERARHRRSPLLTLLLGVTALVGGATLALSALHGSFAAGGASVDHGLSVAAHKSGPTLRGLADDASHGLQRLTGKGA